MTLMNSKGYSRKYINLCWNSKKRKYPTFLHHSLIYLFLLSTDQNVWLQFKNFDIVRFPFWCSNMPNNMFHSTISAEILRIYHAAKTLENFKFAADPFLSRMHKQGALKGETCKSMNKLLVRYSQEFEKYERNKKNSCFNLFWYLV